MNKLKKIFILLMVCILLSGCVKSTATTTISSNKNVNLNFELLISDKFKKNISDFVDKDSLIKRGFTVNETSKDGYTGYTINKKIDNIDNVSSTEDKKVVISDILKSEFDDSVLYKINKSFFKNTYTANYRYRLASLASQNSNVETDVKEDLSSESQYVFKVELPYSVISSNSFIKTNDDKTLIWNLNKSEDYDITYKFYIYNFKNIMIVAGSGLAILIIIIIIIVKVIKKSKNAVNAVHKDEPILVEYDPSIEDKLKDDTPEVAAVDDNVLSGSYEFTLPEEEAAKEAKKIQIEQPTPIREKMFLKDEPVDEILDFSSETKKEEIISPDYEDIRK